MKNKIAILIPVYNEGKVILKTLFKIKQRTKDYLFVDDGSTDNTKEILKTHKANYTGYVINKGKGFAIKYGAQFLINKGYDYILIMDGDGQHWVGDIWKFIVHLEFNSKAKIIIGNRLWDKKQMPLIRYLTNKIMSFLLSCICQQEIKDTQCGFRLLHKDIFDLNTKGLEFEYESSQLIEASQKKYEIISIPIKCIYIKERKSKINPIKHTYKFVKLIINYFLTKKLP